MIVKSISACRSCGSDKISLVISLGEIAVTDFPVNGTPKWCVPLELMLCEFCTLLQLRHTTPPELLYSETYWYMSGVNQTMKNELSGIVESMNRYIRLSAGDIVVDIGCNDGTLLSYYKKSLIKVGFDPAKNLVKLSKKHADCVFVDFFNKESFLKKFGTRRAKAITAISMFYDIEDPNTFLSDITSCLDKDGVFVIQQNYLASMISQNAYDNICHEHLEYYSLESLEHLLRRHDLEVFDVEERVLNGGSFRTYIQKSGGLHTISKAVHSMRARENKLKLDQKATYIAFAKRVRVGAKELYKLISALGAQHKSIYLYGASTRGNTLLQYCHLDNSLIAGAAERNPIKWGKKTTTQIPIFSEEEVRKRKPDYLLVLPWFFKDEFLDREKKYLDAGGSFIFPLPEVSIIRHE